MSSSTSSRDSDLPSIAQTLPPEVLDRILHFHFTARWYCSFRADGKIFCRSWFDREPSFICRSWCGPVQRYLFKSMRISTVAKLQEWGRAKPAFAHMVRTLEVKVENDKHHRWRCKDLNAVLEILPHLTSLSLHLNAASPGYMASYVTLAKQPSLKELALFSSGYDRNMSSFRQILAATPNLVKLTLSTDYGAEDRFALPTRKNIIPTDLTSLTSLALQGVALTELFAKLELRSEGTIKQIVKLDLRFVYGNFGTLSSPSNLMGMMGRNLVEFELPYQQNDNTSYINFMEACPNLKTLVSPRSFHSLSIPSSLESFKLILSNKSYRYSLYSYNTDVVDHKCEWLIAQDRDGTTLYPFQDWKNIKTVEIDFATPTPEVKKFITGKGIDLIINGEFYIPPTPLESSSAE